MSGAGHNSGEAADNIGAAQLRAFVERIERLEEEQSAIGDDKKDTYAEAKSVGFDVKALKTIISIRRKDPAKRQEEALILQTYMAALGME